MLMSMVIANQYRWVTWCKYFFVDTRDTCILFAWIYTLFNVSSIIGIMQITWKYQVGDIWCWKINCAEMFWLNQKYQCFIPCKKFVFILANHFLEVKAVTNSDLLVKKKNEKFLGFFPYMFSILICICIVHNW